MRVLLVLPAMAVVLLAAPRADAARAEPRFSLGHGTSGQSRARPAEIADVSDSGVDRLTWSSWGPDGAVAMGSGFVHRFDAGGALVKRRYPVTVELTDLGQCGADLIFQRMVVTAPGESPPVVASERPCGIALALPRALGHGVIRPRAFSLRPTARALALRDVRWEGWGGPTASGVGRARVGGRLVRATLVAGDAGECRINGKLAYRKTVVRAAGRRFVATMRPICAKHGSF